MDRNVKIAKELVKLAKSLVAGSEIEDENIINVLESIGFSKEGDKYLMYFSGKRDEATVSIEKFDVENGIIDCEIKDKGEGDFSASNYEKIENIQCKVDDFERMLKDALRSLPTFNSGAYFAGGPKYEKIKSKLK